MKVQALAIASSLGLATAFVPTGKVVRTNTLMMADEEAPAAPKEVAMSKSLPFLKKPANTAGWVGDAEFDPFGLSDVVGMEWMREAELKHGRVAMLATVGFLVSQVIHLPGELYSNPNPVEAVYQVGAQPMLQIFIFIGALESILHKGKMNVMNMHADGAVPGDFGFDPLGFMKGKSEAQMNEMKLKELKNGRLAMFAIGGLIHHTFVNSRDEVKVQQSKQKYSTDFVLLRPRLNPTEAMAVICLACVLVFYV